MKSKEKVDSEQMCCCKCGHIASLCEPYETEYPDGENGDEFPICPHCGEWNTGGCGSYARMEVWQQEDFETILELNKNE